MKYLAIFLLILGCNTKVEKASVPEITKTTETSAHYSYLALGDSYTKGESVCDSCGFPSQLVDSLASKYDLRGTVKRIAETGWTTTDLLSGIVDEQPESNYDLVTLLIGVNNQYQGKPFDLYTTEFPILLEKAINFAQNNKTNVIVLSIPDYAYTPYGEQSGNKATISKELDAYNAFAKKICEERGVLYFDITELTRNGLHDKELVASDGLHPSEKAYSLFVRKILSDAKKIVD
ncbi:SGNH/GDSL hydrolase family protein [Jejudonia soesokkakensis]|uniref:SGNH/GDSL hydrolase family protein n=1 Tax=Jejudonia soesokkakensis TaxID=1323432 RepID=A0ABW2MNK5_9FLAO